MEDHKQHMADDHSKHNQSKDPGHSQHSGMDHSMPNMEDHSAHMAHHGQTASVKQEVLHEAHSAHARQGTDHTGHEQMFRVRFWWSLLLNIPVLLYSGMIQMWLGFTPPAFPFSGWIPFVFSVIIFAYGGVPFLQMAVPEIQERKPGMMTPSLRQFPSPSYIALWPNSLTSAKASSGNWSPSLTSCYSVTGSKYSRCGKHPARSMSWRNSCPIRLKVFIIMTAPNLFPFHR